MNKKTSSTEISNPSCGYYFSSGIVVSETVYSSASHGPLYNVASRIIVDGGRKAIATAAMAGMLVQNLKTPAKAADVGPGQTKYIYEGQTSNNLTVSGNLTNTANLYVSGITNNTVLQLNGAEYVYSGGVATSSVIGNSGLQYLDGGTVVGTRINNGGILMVEYGKASGTVINSGGRLWLYEPYYEGQYSVEGVVQNAGGIIDGVIVDKEGLVSIKGSNSLGNFYVSGGVASNFIINSGGQFGIFGGSAYNLHQNSGGIIETGVCSGDSTFVSGVNQYGQTMTLKNGVATNFVMASGGYMQITHGGSAVNLVMESGAVLDTIIDPKDGTYISGTNQDGAFSLKDGVASNLIVSAGDIGVFINSGGQAYNLKQYPNDSYDGGMINISGIQPGDGRIVTGTNQSGNPMSLQNGSASDFIINGYAHIMINSGGIAQNPIINSGGLLTVNQGASASGVVQNYAGGIYAVVSGGDTSTYVKGNYYSSAGAVARPFLLQNGSASGFVVEPGDGNDFFDDNMLYYPGLAVSSGGRAVSILNNGGNVNVDVYANDTSTFVSGSNGVNFFRLQNGVASGFIMNRGGYMNVHSGGSAIATRLNGGSINVESGGYVTGNVSQGGGTVSVEVRSGDTATYVSGTASRYDEEANSTVSSSYKYQNGVASNFIVNHGGYMKVYQGGIVRNVAVFGDGLEDYGEFEYCANCLHGNITVYGNNTLYGKTIMSSGGAITLTRTESNTPATLEIENLSASDGVFVMNVDLENKTGDRIDITGSYSGNAYLQLNNTASGATAISGKDLVLVRHPGAGSSSEEYDPEEESKVFDLLGGKYNFGAYSYTLNEAYNEDEDYTYYYLTGSAKGGSHSPVFRAAMTMPQINIVGVNIALNSLEKRMGDLRGMSNNDRDKGVWGRSYYKSMTVKGSAETDLKAVGTEAGYDWIVPKYTEGGNRMYLGFMMGSMSISDIKSSGDDYKNDGEGSTVLAGIYGTYISDNHWFADATFRTGQSKIEMSNYTLSGGTWDKTKFEPKRMFAAASVEGGKQYDMDNYLPGLKIEPKAELQLTYVLGKSVNDNNGDIVKFGGAGYVTGIATLHASYAKRDGGWHGIEPYGELSYAKDFVGEENITYLGATEKSSIKGGSVEVAAGMNMKVSDDMYWHAALNYESGSKKKSYGLDAGIRYMFGGKSAEKHSTVAAKNDVRVEHQKEIVKEVPDAKKTENTIATPEKPKQSVQKKEAVRPETKPAPKKVVTKPAKSNAKTVEKPGYSSDNHPDEYDVVDDFEKSK